MIRLSEIKLTLAEAEQPEATLHAAARRLLGLDAADIARVEVFKRSFDARKADPRRGLHRRRHAGGPGRAKPQCSRRFADHPHIAPTPDMDWRPPVQAARPPPLRPVVVGFGPCGLFAALVLAQMGFRPIVLERGKAVRERTKDTWGLWRKSVLNPEIERAVRRRRRRHLLRRQALQPDQGPAALRPQGADTSSSRPARRRRSCTSAKPHIGTFRLVTMVEKHARRRSRRSAARSASSSSVDRPADRATADARRCAAWCWPTASALRSRPRRAGARPQRARHLRRCCTTRGVYIEAKPFSIGFRIEHPQSLIDRARFGRYAGHPMLGAADYKLVHHASNGRSVYSFCMCPGGTVVAATSEPGRVVTNGMSQYSRNERNANAGIVVGITPRDYPGGPLAGIAFQRQLGIERLRARRRRLRGARPAGRRLPRRPAVHAARERRCRRTSRA